MTETLETFLTEWTTAEQHGDSDQLRGMLTEDFLGVGPLGFVLSKSDWLARFGNGLAYDRFELGDLRRREYDTAAVITADQTGSGTFAGNPLPFKKVRATLSLIQNDTRWQLAGIHLSFIAGTAGAPPLPGAPGSSKERSQR